jgi:hypothetical protein
MGKLYHIAGYFTAEQYALIKSLKDGSHNAFVKELVLEGIKLRQKEIELFLQDNKQDVITLLKTYPVEEAAGLLSKRFGHKIPESTISSFVSNERVEERSFDKYEKLSTKG